MVGGGEAVIFLEKPGRSKESKGRTRRWGQGHLGVFGGGCQSVWLGCSRVRRATACPFGGKCRLYQSAWLGFLSRFAGVGAVMEWAECSESSLYACDKPAGLGK